MKTLSEYESARSLAENRAGVAYIDNERAWVTAVEDQRITLYSSPKDLAGSVERRRDNLDRMRSLVRAGETRRLGVACDNCGTELIDRCPGSITASNPPLRYVGCIGCGWIGWMRR
jgi:predicted RNA-binding Zn-ribbon protein involved in translation (DUF1610 family)